jgi:hypothetical protein
LKLEKRIELYRKKIGEAFVEKALRETVEILQEILQISVV